MSESYAPYRRKIDHDFIHKFTPKIQKLKKKHPEINKELEEILTITEKYIQSSLQRETTKELDGMKGFDL